MNLYCGITGVAPSVTANELVSGRRGHTVNQGPSMAARCPWPVPGYSCAWPHCAFAPSLTALCLQPLGHNVPLM